VRPEVAHVAKNAFVSGFNLLIWIAAAVAFIGSLCSLVLIRQRDVISGQGGPVAEPASVAAGG
jgi:hypothetical protein